MPFVRSGRENDKLAYRADIDGLRAVSILLVIGYHARLVSGGFIGVDIFFVISGFLITRIILNEAGAGTFSPAQFYARRIRRIFPALIVVLAVSWLVGWFVLQDELIQTAVMGSLTDMSVAKLARQMLKRLSSGKPESESK